MAETDARGELLALASSIVAAHVSHNNLPSSELPQLLKDVYTTLDELGNEEQETQPKLEPAVSIRKSVTPDFIVCLEDGKKLKMLKRHLKTAYDLSPEEYRERWGLPSDYPMVAPNYAKQRSQLAKEIGLGSRKRKR